MDFHELEKIAEQRGVSTAQLAIAWVLSRGGDIIPLIGTKRRDRLAAIRRYLDFDAPVVFGNAFIAIQAAKGALFDLI